MGAFVSTLMISQFFRVAGVKNEKLFDFYISYGRVYLYVLLLVIG